MRFGRPSWSKSSALPRPTGPAEPGSSIGFGPSLISWTDKHGVEWRIASIPLGGYVRFAGDENAASVPDQDNLDAMRDSIVRREGEAGVSKYFHFKPVWQRAIIAVAGPVSNFVLAILIMAVFLVLVGSPQRVASVNGVVPGGAAAVAPNRKVRTRRSRFPTPAQRG